MKYLKINPLDIANGLGIRISLWISGCDIHCKGCHNPESWDFNNGQDFTSETMDYLLTLLEPDRISGITFTGGHPLAEQNLEEVYNIIRRIKKQLPNKTIWLYTGKSLNIKDFTIETSDNLLMCLILRACDIVVDGPYIAEERDITLHWAGSRNQRVIDVKKTIKTNKIVLFDS